MIFNDNSAGYGTGHFVPKTFAQETQDRRVVTHWCWLHGDRKSVAGDGEDGVAATAKCGDRRAIEPEVPWMIKDWKSMEIYGNQLIMHYAASFFRCVWGMLCDVLWRLLRVSKDLMRAGLMVWGISGPRVPNFANSTGLRPWRYLFRWLCHLCRSSPRKDNYKDLKMQQNEFKEDFFFLSMYNMYTPLYKMTIQDVLKKGMLWCFKGMLYIVSGFCGFCSAKPSCWAWHFPFGEQWLTGSEAGHPNGSPRWWREKAHASERFFWAMNTDQTAQKSADFHQIQLW